MSGYQPTNSHDVDDDVRPYNEKQRRGASPWLKFGVPLAIVLVLGAVLGGVLGTQLNKKSSNDNSTGSGGSGSSTSLSPGASSSLAASVSSAKANLRFATGTDTYMLPIYPSTTNSALYGDPTLATTPSAAWPTDTFKPSTPSVTTVRSDRPRLIAPAYKWNALPGLIAQDPYLKGWNNTIFGNATQHLSEAVVPFILDGSSGALDPARHIKLRIKNLAYAYRMSNNSVYAERVWTELVNAANNGTTSFGTSPDNWNSGHFLDTAEFTAGFAIAYDWLYDYWTPTRRTAIMWSIINLGLKYGLDGYNTNVWWSAVNGNWNCVSNSGMIMGALAILNDDPSGSASQILSNAVPNALGNCAQAPTVDGTWSETANYWYFGTTGHAEMVSSLLTATGGDYKLVPNTFNLSAYYHIYVTGMTSLFNYGDHGPNKFSTTANSMMFYSDYFSNPTFTLFQRDRYDASEPTAMFWYNPEVTGAWWDGLALDHDFTNTTDSWGSMRSSWTDNTGTYIAMKAGSNSGHQTHNDLDGGDFVLDAMGQRWAGELGSGDYNSEGYFVGTDPDSDRWLYYRKRTEGQNTLVVNQQNQVLTAQPPTKFGSSGTVQNSSTVVTLDKDDTAFFTADLTDTYDGTSIKRGIRFLNSRRQILLQDDISNSGTSVQWRMHTNATVTTSGTTATLSLGGKTMQVSILNAPSGVSFTTAEPVRYSSDPALPSGAVDSPNPGVTVLVIDIPSGTNSIQVLFNPQWSDFSSSDYVTPPSVSIDNWSLTSHN
ncbi:hypothetical protein DL93DRAFT_2125146 [Clavulina sp. PMI_390]|nr:hypothetical protein DL93DRAFT_2125146 [Clavulina sp. PMI_390]